VHSTRPCVEAAAPCLWVLLLCKSQPVRAPLSVRAFTRVCSWPPLAPLQLADIATRHGIIRKTEFEIESVLEQMSKMHKEESGKVRELMRAPACVCLCVRRTCVQTAVSASVCWRARESVSTVKIVSRVCVPAPF